MECPDAAAEGGGGGGVSYSVAIGEHQGVLVRGVQRGERALKVDHSYVAGVGVGLAALSPTGVGVAGGASAFEGGAFYGPLS
ncbi:hypothetical protein P8935_01245 [Telmatobacter sp. DSM 110680]|uniref:Uncharacterized protein n=1 Tax=Telmatobacter sp. DSM 110680 TaxID=3036704 RepID=A0AAU7DJW5_9BACT